MDMPAVKLEPTTDSEQFPQHFGSEKQYGVFDAIFKKSNEYWKQKSEEMSESEYEAWVMNYVEDPFSMWKHDAIEETDSKPKIEPDYYENITYRCIGCDEIFLEADQMARHNTENILQTNFISDVSIKVI